MTKETKTEVSNHIDVDLVGLKSLFFFVNSSLNSVVVYMIVIGGLHGR
jgi:hypothetical protein